MLKKSYAHMFERRLPGFSGEVSIQEPGGNQSHKAEPASKMPRLRTKSTVVLSLAVDASSIFQFKFGGAFWV